MSWRDHREALVRAGGTRLLWLCVLTFGACQVNIHGPGEPGAGGSGGAQQPSGGTTAASGGSAGVGGSAVNGGASGSVEAGAPTQPDAGESSSGEAGGGTGGGARGGNAGENHGGTAHAGAAGASDGGISGMDQAGGTGGNGCGRVVIEVTSLIDGLDRLSIRPEQMGFEHVTQAGPGLESFRREPTRVDVTVGETTRSVAWCPIWDDGCNTCDGSCGELRVQGARSRGLCGEYFPGPISNLAFSCTGAEGRFGASCALTQEPSEANGQHAIVTFDDDLAGGPTYYTARLAFDYGPSENGECDVGQPPETCDPPPSSEQCYQQGEIEVTTLVDGYDRLTLTPDSIQFHHSTHAGPGMAAFRTESTAVNVTLGSSSTEIEWCPTWENGCNTCDGSCGELRERVSSLPLEAELFRGCPSLLEFSCSGPEDRPYAFCTLVQSPSAANDHTTVIDLDDDYPEGPAYFTARLRYQFNEGVACGCYPD